MYPGREVFPDPPLEYVAAEIRFPYAPRLRQQETLDSVLLEVQDTFPIIRQAQQVSLPGLGAPQIEQISKGFDRSSTKSMLVTSTVLTIDTTHYASFEKFAADVACCIQAVQRYGSVAAVERIGIRYVNEIRVPLEPQDARDWKGWVSDDLLAPVRAGNGFAVTHTQGVVQYSTGVSRFLAFRFGAAAGGPGAIGENPLKRRHSPSPGPYFLLDLDSYWEPAPEDAQDFESETIMTILHDLHGPVGSVFQASITEQLRQVLRGRAS